LLKIKKLRNEQITTSLIVDFFCQDIIDRFICISLILVVSITTIENKIQEQ